MSLNWGSLPRCSTFQPEAHSGSNTASPPIPSVSSPDHLTPTPLQEASHMPGSCVLPDDGDELGHGELMRHQELGFVQRREILLPLVALDDHLDGRDRWEGRKAPGEDQPHPTPPPLHHQVSSPTTYRDLVGELGADPRHLLLPGSCTTRRNTDTSWEDPADLEASSCRVLLRVLTEALPLFERFVLQLGLV